MDEDGYLIDPSAPLPRPEWVEKINDEGRMYEAVGMLGDMVPLDLQSLLDAATRETGLTDMELGDDDWREPLSVLLRALEEEAQLNLMGRLISRGELIVWIRARLKLVDLVKRHPEIREVPIEKPIFITGLPRTGTSILQEVFGRDPQLRTPLLWENYFPAEAAESRGQDTVAQRVGGQLADQWGRVVPEIRTMHETGWNIPAEDATIWCPTFISDHIMSFYQIPSYHKYVNAADPLIPYRFHKLFLQALQWRMPQRRWFGKTLYHLGNLPKLFEVYPDARVVHTHRDPLRSMASITSLLRAFFWQRSDRDFDAPGFSEIMLAEPTSQRLYHAMDLRDRGVVPAAQIADSRYQDLLDDPVNAMRRLYGKLDLPFTDETARGIADYLAFKPKHKHGEHKYRTMSAEQVARARPYFRRYQERYQVPDEV